VETISSKGGRGTHQSEPETAPLTARVLDQNRLALILRLRDERKLGPTRIQAELLRHHAIRWSTATIWKVLHSHARAPLVRKRPPESPRRYSRPLPGDRVQVDTMKVSPGPLPVHRH
jgi:hypothetical protein